MAADVIRTERPGRSTASRARWRTLPRGAHSKAWKLASQLSLMSIKRVSTIQTPYDSGDIRYSISGWLLQRPLDSTAM